MSTYTSPNASNAPINAVTTEQSYVGHINMSTAPLNDQNLLINSNQLVPTVADDDESLKLFVGKMISSFYIIIQTYNYNY